MVFMVMRYQFNYLEIVSKSLGHNWEELKYW